MLPEGGAAYHAASLGGCVDATGEAPSRGVFPLGENGDAAYAACHDACSAEPHCTGFRLEPAPTSACVVYGAWPEALAVGPVRVKPQVMLAASIGPPVGTLDAAAAGSCAASRSCCMAKTSLSGADTAAARLREDGERRHVWLQLLAHALWVRVPESVCEELWRIDFHKAHDAEVLIASDQLDVGLAPLTQAHNVLGDYRRATHRVGCWCEDPSKQPRRCQDVTATEHVAHDGCSGRGGRDDMRHAQSSTRPGEHRK